MYYIGTQAECNAYNEQVKQGENYDGVDTTDWATPIAHPNGTDYAIIKHDNYTSSMTSQDSLGDDWYPDNI